MTSVRVSADDVAEAEAAIARLAAAPADDRLVLRDLWLLRVRALLAQAQGNDAAYRITAVATAPWPQSWASRAT